MAKAMRMVGSEWRVVEIPELPECPPWCEGLDPYPCWGHDLGDGWTVSHTKDLGAGVSVVQTGRWTPGAGLTTDPAECALSNSEDRLLALHEIPSIVEALTRALSLIEEINRAHDS